MTCSNTIDEMLTRPVRMQFIEFEALHAKTEDECRWPQDSHERDRWMYVFRQKKSPPDLETGGALIPHQRDAEMASTAAS
jgi:hypothetical protein